MISLSHRIATINHYSSFKFGYANKTTKNYEKILIKKLPLVYRCKELIAALNPLKGTVKENIFPSLTL